METILSKSIDETEQWAKRILKTISPQKSGATVVGLTGNLGAGKTAFAKCVAKVLGVRETVTSPTFVIEKIYKIRHPYFHRLIHVDAYRIEKSDELLHLGWREIVSDPRNLILLEWPERVSDILPRGTNSIRFKFVNESTRKINLPAPPKKLVKLKARS